MNINCLFKWIQFIVRTLLISEYEGLIMIGYFFIHIEIEDRVRFGSCLAVLLIKDAKYGI